MTIPTEDTKYDSSDSDEEETTHDSSHHRTDRKSVNKTGSVASRMKNVRMLKKFIEKVIKNKGM